MVVPPLAAELAKRLRPDASNSGGAVSSSSRGVHFEETRGPEALRPSQVASLVRGLAQSRADVRSCWPALEAVGSGIEAGAWDFDVLEAGMVGAILAEAHTAVAVACSGRGVEFAEPGLSEATVGAAATKPAPPQFRTGGNAPAQLLEQLREWGLERQGIDELRYTLQLWSAVTSQESAHAVDGGGPGPEAAELQRLLHQTAEAIPSADFVQSAHFLSVWLRLLARSSTAGGYESEGADKDEGREKLKLVLALSRRVNELGRERGRAEATRELRILFQTGRWAPALGLGPFGAAAKALLTIVGEEGVSPLALRNVLWALAQVQLRLPDLDLKDWMNVLYSAIQYFETHGLARPAYDASDPLGPHHAGASHLRPVSALPGWVASLVQLVATLAPDRCPPPGPDGESLLDLLRLVDCCRGTSVERLVVWAAELVEAEMKAHTSAAVRDRSRSALPQVAPDRLTGSSMADTHPPVLEALVTQIASGLPDKAARHSFLAAALGKHLEPTMASLALERASTFAGSPTVDMFSMYALDSGKPFERSDSPVAEAATILCRRRPQSPAAFVLGSSAMSEVGTVRSASFESVTLWDNRAALDAGRQASEVAGVEEGTLHGGQPRPWAWQLWQTASGRPSGVQDLALPVSDMRTAVAEHVASLALAQAVPPMARGKKDLAESRSPSVERGSEDTGEHLSAHLRRVMEQQAAAEEMEKKLAKLDERLLALQAAHAKSPSAARASLPLGKLKDWADEILNAPQTIPGFLERPAHGGGSAPLGYRFSFEAFRKAQVSSLRHQSQRLRVLLPPERVPMGPVTVRNPPSR